MRPGWSTAPPHGRLRLSPSPHSGPDKGPHWLLYGGCPTRSRGALKPGSLRRWRGEAAWDRLPPGARAGGLHVTCGIISWPIQVTTEECVLLEPACRLPLAWPSKAACQHVGIAVYLSKVAGLCAAAFWSRLLALAPGQNHGHERPRRSALELVPSRRPGLGVLALSAFFCGKQF